MNRTGSVIRVRYAETDQMGVAYHGAILPWFEIARTDWLRCTGMSYRRMEEEFRIHFAVVEASFRYVKRILYDDELVARATPENVGSVKLEFSYVLTRGEEICVTGRSLHACVDSSGKPVRMPETLARLLQAVG